MSALPLASRPPRSIANAGLLLAALVLVAFWPVASGARNFFHLDLRYEHLPVWEAVQAALRSGSSPFWLPGEYCGQPLLFTQEAPVFYPLTVALLRIGAPVERLSDLFALFHYWLAGFAAFLLLRDLEADETSSLFGAVAWMLSARLVQSAIWPNAVAVAALLPLVLLGILRIGRARRSGVAIAALSGGLAILAARPQSLLAASPLLGAAAFAAVLLAARRARAAGDLLAAGVLALAIGAASWVPSAALYAEMSRAGGLSRADRDLNPIGFGSGLDLVFLPVDGPGRWPEAAAYPGLAAALLFLAGLGLALARRDSGLPRVLFLALAAGGVIGLLFAFGERGPYRLFAELPVISGFRVPARYLLSWSLALALTSALALAAVRRRFSRAPGLAAAALLLLTADLTWHAWRAAPTAEAALGRVEPEIVSRLRGHLGPDEAGFPRRFWSLAPPVNLLAFPESQRLAVARREEPLSGALGMRYGLESVSGGGPLLTATEKLLVPPGARGAELAGVAAAVVAAPDGAGRGGLEVQPLSALPRALLVPEAVFVAPEAAVAATLSPRLDPRRVAVVEGPPFPSSGPGLPAGDVRLLARRPSRLELETHAPGDRVLVLFDAFEKGWRASVDGAPATVFRADAAFRSVRVPAGAHRVTFSYRPPGLREGLGISAAGLLGLLLFVMRAGREVLA